MRLEDALRKVRLLHNCSVDRGAFEAEAKNAIELAKRLMEQHAITKLDVRPNREDAPSRLRKNDASSALQYIVE
jgi:Protein of unknown function (DUF2786)